MGRLAKALREPGSVGAWDHDDAEVIRAQSDTGHLFEMGLQMVLPAMPGAAEALEESGSAFLDVGCGAGAVGFVVLRLFPACRVVGLDVNTTALEQCRSRVAEEGLAERFEVRNQPVEELDDVDEFDLSFFPHTFIPREVCDEGLRRVARATKPGGWVVALCWALEIDDPLLRAVRGFRARLWGGSPSRGSDVAEQLRAAGLVDEQVPQGMGQYQPVLGRAAERPRCS
ncbi:MAG: class I SAM-dependent methyltransferase [Acidimicrobiia bacterium]|nr:class I SAM-dependent methyltransferase [Acidimicrobiia bacterium]